MNFLRTLLLLTVLFATACSREEKKPAPEVFGPMPSFQLTDSKGLAFSHEDLKGKFGILNFFFSSCQGICPSINGHMRSVVEDFQKIGGFTATSLSVDPKRDSPEKLLDYSKKYIPDGFAAWHFLTQTEESQTKTKELVTEGFRLAQGESMDMHSTRIVLFDKKYQVRGYYKGLEGAEILRLKDDIRALLASEEL